MNNNQEDQPAKDPFSEVVPERLWLSFTNVCDKDKFRVTLEVNGKPGKVFEKYVSQDDCTLCESWSLTWLIRNAVKAEREKIFGMLRETFPKDSDGPYRSGEWFADWLEERLK